MKKLLLTMFLVLSMIFLASCEGGGPKPTFLNMRNGTLDDFERAQETSGVNIQLSHETLNFEEPIDFIGDVKVVKRLEEIVLLFDIQQPEDNSYIRTDFAVRLYSNYDFTDGTIMPEGEFDYEWFSKDYEGIGKLYLLKTNIKNLDTLVIKIPVMAKFPNELEIGVDMINYDGIDGSSIEYDSAAISSLKFVVGLEDNPEYEFFLEMSQYNEISKELRMAVGQDMFDEPDIMILNENTKYTVVINNEIVEIDADLYSRVYLLNGVYFIDVDLGAHNFMVIYTIDLNFIYLIFNGEQYMASLNATFEYHDGI